MSSQRRPPSARGRTTRGPLPADIYWRRRFFVLALAFSLVFVIARWLSGGSDAESTATPAAEQAGAQVSATQTVTVGEGTTDGATEDPADPAGKASAEASPTLAAPDGTCDAADVVVTPSVAKGAVAGQDVTLALSLQTLESEACTWRVARNTLTVRISQGGTEVWTTRQCPKVVPSESVVVRRAVATVVELTWPETRESNEGCTKRAGWALPGTFTIAAAALGGEPSEAEFTLVGPSKETVSEEPDQEWVTFN